MDENRLLQEVVILLEKKDITEEIVRLRSHFDLLNFINNKEPIGKKMNFLHQEMLREVNTIGSKTDNITISHIVINMKEELEKIKEQVEYIMKQGKLIILTAPSGTGKTSICKKLLSKVKNGISVSITI